MRMRIEKLARSGDKQAQRIFDQWLLRANRVSFSRQSSSLLPLEIDCNHGEGVLTANHIFYGSHLLQVHDGEGEGEGLVTSFAVIYTFAGDGAGEGSSHYHAGTFAFSINCAITICKNW